MHLKMRATSTWVIILTSTVVLNFAFALPQSNDGIQGNDVEFINYDNDKNLPPNVTLDGKVTQFDDLLPRITLNRTTGVLNCAEGSMKMELIFKEAFYGVAYADFDRNSACYVQGTGNLRETIELPLKGCGTKQDPTRVFTNNVIIRFHPGLEMQGDEVITIVCRYPPPKVVPPPEAIIQGPVLLPPAVAAPLKEFQVLMIICAILFLGLMLLGLGCSTFCLKRRNIQVIRKRPFTPLEDESEKLSSVESSYATPVKIPRVHAPSTESSSEVPLEETLGSDYPSSIEDAARPDTVSSEYSDTHANLEVETVAPPPVMAKIHEPLRSFQETELLDNLTVIDREDVARETRYAQPVIVPRKPEVSVHTVDDVYLQTIVERRLIEDEERRIREVTQFYKKDEPKWDVMITSRAGDDDDWERGSETTDVASSIGWSTVEETPIRPRRQFSKMDQDLLSRRTDVTRSSHETTSVARAMQRLQESESHVWNEKWRVLLRVLESPPPPPPESDHESNYDSYSETASAILTEEDREKWRQIITKESTLRSLLTQATVREDYERIRRDTRYESIFLPEKWDVIIRVLAPPGPEHELRNYPDDTSSIDGGRSVADRSESEIVEFAPLDEDDDDSTVGIMEQRDVLGLGLSSSRHRLVTNEIRRQIGSINAGFSSTEASTSFSTQAAGETSMSTTGLVQEVNSTTRTTYTTNSSSNAQASSSALSGRLTRQ